MANANIDDLDCFAYVGIDDDESDYYDSNTSRAGKSLPNLPPDSTIEPTPVNFIDFEKYVEEKCENKIKLLDRSTFHHIKRPIVICFNYFREKCFYHTQYLDRIYQLALKYGDRIEFIVADRMDIDVIYPGRNPISFYYNLVSPEKEKLSIYVIDEQKRIHWHDEDYQTVETISEVCKCLLDGSLYLSQPIPPQNDCPVKVCVHQNFDEMVTNSTKDVLLIIGQSDYAKCEEFGPDYEKLAEELKDCNFAIVHINGELNFIPIQYDAFPYTTAIVFVPHQHKDSLMHFPSVPWTTENMRDFIQHNIGPQGESWRQKQFIKLKYNPFSLPKDRQLKFTDLEQYVNENFPNSLEILDRSTFDTSKRRAIIHFMNIEGKGVAFYLETLRKIHQVAAAQNNFGVQFLVADYKDLDVVYPPWYKKYLVYPHESIDTPKVFALDIGRRVYETDEFETASLLFFFYYDLTHSRVFRTQPWYTSKCEDLVKPLAACNFNQLIQKSETDIFLTIYWPTYEASQRILTVLNEIVDEVVELNVNMLKMDAKENYLSVEYCYPTYPVHFFIPHRDKDNGVARYISASQSREDILEFIRYAKENNLS